MASQTDHYRMVCLYYNFSYIMLLFPIAKVLDDNRFNLVDTTIFVHTLKLTRVNWTPLHLQLGKLDYRHT